MSKHRKRRSTRDAGEWMSSRQRDVELAHKRLGNSDQRCRWILDEFMVRDPNTLSTGERAVWRDNLTALVLGPRPGAGARWVTINENDPLIGDLHDLWLIVRRFDGAHRESVSLSPLAGWIGRVDDVAATARTPYVRLRRGARAEHFHIALEHAIADLLIGCERLRECPECNRLFVATRRQERHRQCAQRARDRKRHRPNGAKGKANG